MLRITTLLKSIVLILIIGLSSDAFAQSRSRVDLETKEMLEMNNQIRREKFDQVLPIAMRNHGVDMWIYIVTESIPDKFGAEEFGSSSGIFVFTDKGDRIERAVMGRRWGKTQRFWEDDASNLVETCGAYDIVYPAIPEREPVGSVLSEFDYRFKGLKEFVQARNPKKIAVNYLHDLGPWVAFSGVIDDITFSDGISLTDYLLLTEELGDELSSRIVSGEYVLMEYTTRKVPTEIKFLKDKRKQDIKNIKQAFKKVVPGVTKVKEAEVGTFRRMKTGQSQRGRSFGWEDAIIQGGDILYEPLLGMYAYVLKDGEKKPPTDIQKLWNEYLKIDKILAEEIRSGLTPREIIDNYTKRFEDEGIIVRGNQMHMIQPQNYYDVYTAGFDKTKTHISMDCHGMKKGALKRGDENYFGPRIGSLGPDWARDLPLPENHHFVLEYFFYVPSPTDNPEEDQYLFWWDHEEALVTAQGVEYLSEPQKELILIK